MFDFWKIQRKENEEEKINLKLINYFYILFQIYLTYFLRLNNFKIYKFLINFNYILFFTVKPKKKIISLTIFFLFLVFFGS